jgi:phage shock protein A
VMSYRPLSLEDKVRELERQLSDVKVSNSRLKERVDALESALEISRENERCERALKWIERAGG